MDTSTADSEDTEEQKINKKLTDYGIEELGMTLDEKKNFLLVLKNSESTALAEEHSRVGLELLDTSNNPIQSNSDVDVVQSYSDPKNNSTGEERSEEAAFECFSGGETLTKPCSVVDIVPNDADDSHSPKQKGVVYSSSKFTPKTSRLSLKSRIVSDGEENVVACLLSESNSPKCKSPPFQKLFEDTSTKTELQSIEDPICLKNNLPLPIRKKEDRKRNIDVFNAVKDRNEHPLTINKQLKINGKTPYYVVPHGMDIKEFTIYFKEQLATMATHLIATQRKSLKLVPWGDPVVVSNLENKLNNNSTFEENIGPADNDTVDLNTPAQNQRYNFRGRSNKRKCEDDIFNYKVSDEDTSDDDNTFFKKATGRPKLSEKTKIASYSGNIAKRKSVFSAVGELLGEKETDICPDNTFCSNTDGLNVGDTDKDSASEDESKNKSCNPRIKNICKSGILRSKETGEHSSCNTREPLRIVDDDDDEDYEVGQENKNYKKKIQKSNTKLQIAKKKKNVSKPLEQTGSQEDDKNGEVSGVSKRPSGWLNTIGLNDQQNGLNAIKPSPINPKLGRLKRSNSTFGKTKKKFTKIDIPEVDDVVWPSDNEERDIPVEMGELTACPMCKEMFGINEIVQHAADCNGHEDPDAVNSDYEPTSRCPICVESFRTGPEFNKHAECCNVKKRLVAPPVGPSARNRTKR